jgi:hypothetical protein
MKIKHVEIEGPKGRFKIEMGNSGFPALHQRTSRKVNRASISDDKAAKWFASIIEGREITSMIDNTAREVSKIIDLLRRNR